MTQFPFILCCIYRMPRIGFWFGEAVNDFFENENFDLILFSEFQNFDEANGSAATVCACRTQYNTNITHLHST